MESFVKYFESIFPELHDDPPPDAEKWWGLVLNGLRNNDETYLKVYCDYCQDNDYDPVLLIGEPLHFRHQIRHEMAVSHEDSWGANDVDYQDVGTQVLHNGPASWLFVATYLKSIDHHETKLNAHQFRANARQISSQYKGIQTIGTEELEISVPTGRNPDWVNFWLTELI